MNPDPITEWVLSSLSRSGRRTRETQPYVNKFDRKKSKKKSAAEIKRSQQRATQRAIQEAKTRNAR